jgi:hypothetical protein
VQADVAELRHRITHLTLAAEIDEANEPELAEARKRLAWAEARTRELSAAEQLARDLAKQAKEKALAARRDADWSAASKALDDCLTTARALDDVAKQLGGLYRELRQQQVDAVRMVGPHLGRIEHQISVQPANLDDRLLLVVANAGGPAVDPRTTLHLSADERDRASVAGMVEHHARTVMNYRPAPATEQKGVGHD